MGRMGWFFKDGILKEVISIWVQLCSVAHFSVIKSSIGAISCTADCTDSNFDDRETGNWTELYSYWNYFLQNTIFNSRTLLNGLWAVHWLTALKLSSKCCESNYRNFLDMQCSNCHYYCTQTIQNMTIKLGARTKT